MKYPNLTQERLRMRIERLQKQNRLLRAGAVEAVIAQNYVEICNLKKLLAASTTALPSTEDEDDG